MEIGYESHSFLKDFPSKMPKPAKIKTAKSVENIANN